MVAGGSVHGPRMGYVSSGEDGPWTGAPGEASRLNKVNVRVRLNW
jgi:hypothetical protein